MKVKIKSFLVLVLFSFFLFWDLAVSLSLFCSLFPRALGLSLGSTSLSVLRTRLGWKWRIKNLAAFHYSTEIHC